MNKDNTVRQAGGFIIQLMPNTDDAVISRLEENIGKLPDVTEMLREGKNPEELLETVLSGFDLTITDRQPVNFSCNCSRDRVSRALKLLGPEELDSMINDGEPVTLHCQFCEKQYTFNIEELKGLRAGLPASE